MCAINAGTSAPHVSLRGVAGPALRAIAKRLSPETGLLSLDLSYCWCGDDVGVALAAMLSRGARVERLDLAHNRLGPISVRALAEAVLTMPACPLRLLSLERNPVTAGPSTQDTAVNKQIIDEMEGAQYGAGASPCGGNKTRALDYSGVAALGALLQSLNQPLVHLNLFRVGLGAEGGSLLARSLSGALTDPHKFTASCSLQQLIISPYDGVCDADIETIRALLKRNIAIRAAELDATREEDVKAACAAAVATSALELATEASARLAWATGEAAHRAAVRREVEYRLWRTERHAEMDRELAEVGRRDAVRVAAATAVAAAALAAKGAKRSRGKPPRKGTK